MRHANDTARPEATGINVIPLADVLLVLLIIFMVTAPTASVTLAMELPQHAPPAPSPPPEALVLRVDAAGDVYWNGVLLPPADLGARLKLAGAAAPDAQPVLRIDASDEADYDAVAQVLAAAQDAGMRRVGFSR